MTFEYDEKIKEQIESIDASVEKLNEAFSKMAESINSFLERLQKSFEEIKQFKPRQQYKIVKKLGIENYEVFFERRTIHRARNCC